MLWLMMVREEAFLPVSLRTVWIIFVASVLTSVPTRTRFGGSDSEIAGLATLLTHLLCMYTRRTSGIFAWTPKLGIAASPATPTSETVIPTRLGLLSFWWAPMMGCFTPLTQP